MPIYMKIDGIKGDVQPAGTANGGVWKTTNFLTNDPVARLGAGPHVKVFSGSTGGGLIQVTQISLSTGANSVEASDPGARFKVGQIVNTARTQRTQIKVFLCPSDPQPSTRGAHARLLLGTDQGVWRSAASRKPHIPNNLKQMPLAALNQTTVEIIVTDASGTVLDTHRFERSTVSRHPGGIMVGLCDGSVR